MIAIIFFKNHHQHLYAGSGQSHENLKSQKSILSVHPGSHYVHQVSRRSYRIP
jgi:hypothetical protein